MEEIQVVDAFGKCCYRQNLSKSNFLELDLVHLATGVYYARILVSNGQFIQKQVIIE